MKPILLDFPMPITTDRLIIRPPEIGDGTMINEAVLESYDLLHATMDWAKEKPSVQDSEERVRQEAANWILKRSEEPWLPLFIFDKTSNGFIGACGYHHMLWEIPSVETGYWIRNSCSGKGFMTEAINALTQYAFKQLQVKRIMITCDADNVRSRNIPERLGYALEGRLKNHRRKPITNELGDTLVYSKYDLNGMPDLLVTW